MITAVTKCMLIGSMLFMSTLCSVGINAREPQVAGLAGTWTLTIETPMGISNPILTVRKSADGYDGTYESRRGKRGVDDIQVNGNEFSFHIIVSMPMGDFEMVYKGSIEGETMSGMIGNPMGEIGFAGRRSR